MKKAKASGLLLSTLWSLIIISLIFILIQVSLQETIANSSLQKKIIPELLLEEQVDAFLFSSEVISENKNLYPTNFSGELIQTIWGAYDLLQSSIITKKDTLQKSYLIGYPSDKSRLIFESIPERITLSQNVSIKGETNIPWNRIKRIPSNDGIVWKWQDSLSLNDKRISSFPADQIWSSTYISRKKKETEDVIDQLSKINSTSIKGTIWLKGVRVDVEITDQDTLSNILLKESKILFCQESIVIDSSCSLEDVWIIAKEIEILDGFYGTVHLTAIQKVTIGDNIVLAYPSSINVLDGNGISLQVGNSQIEGVILGLNDSKNSKATFHSDSKFSGDLIWLGKVQLAGFFEANCVVNEVYIGNQSFFQSDAINKFIFSPQTRSNSLVGIGSGKGVRLKELKL